MKNITLSADEALIAQARDEARARKTTLNQLFRDWLASLARQRERQTEVAELLNRLQYARAGRKFTREESNEG
jgi:hypothetical protein